MKYLEYSGFFLSFLCLITQELHKDALFRSTHQMTHYYFPPSMSAYGGPQYILVYSGLLLDSGGG